MSRLLRTSFLTLLIISSLATATIIHVPEDQPTIQAGINLAVDGDTVLVQPDTYIENINYNGKNIVVASLFLTTGDTSYISQTVIDGDSNGTVVTFENGEDSTAVLSGFTITNGSATYGGGVYCIYSNPSLMNLTIMRNSVVPDLSTGRGGGIYCGASNPILINVTITENTSSHYGGGIFLIWYSSPILKNVTITDNIASERGGGITCADHSNPELVNVFISGNLATSNGGGIYCLSNSSPNLRNVTIVNNTAYKGGGIYCWHNSNPDLINVTIARNSATNGSGIFVCCSSISLINSILWENSSDQIYLYENYDPSSIIVTYTDLQNGEDGIITNGNGTIYWMEGSIDAGPLFIDPENGNFQLQEESPCIDAGTDFFVWEGDTLVDLSPDEYQGNAPDMGAFESPYTASVSEQPQIPHKFALYQNYPNPFNPVTTIRFDLPEDADVRLTVYDVLGRIVEELVSGQLVSGIHEVEWNASGVSSGIYLCKLTTHQSMFTKKMVVMK